MKEVALFHKVSFDRFMIDMKDSFPGCTDTYIKDVYDNIHLPERGTRGSAGYDFYSPIRFELKPGENIKFPTGIRCEINDGWFMSIYPRSSIGFKTGVTLANTVGIIDSDYFHADNEGHIFIKLINDSSLSKELAVMVGDAVSQGIFTKYGITFDDNADVVRIGGLGSTNK